MRGKMRVRGVSLMTVSLMAGAFVTVSVAFSVWASDAAEPWSSTNQTNQEIPLMPGFPVEIGAEMIDPFSRGVVLADLDGDEDLEIVYAITACEGLDVACGEGLVLAWDHQGNTLPGFPIPTNGQAFYSPSVGDLDADGDEEIVVVTVEEEVGFHLYVFDHNGSILNGFPVFKEFVGNGYTTLFDLDSDGFLEIVWSEPTALSVFESDGTEWSDEGWPVELFRGEAGWRGRIAEPPAIGDVDGDGSVEIILWLDYDKSIHVITSNGEELAGWPMIFSFDLDECGIVLADLDNDLDAEIIVTVNKATNGVAEDEVGAEIFVFQHDGELVQGWPKELLQHNGAALWGKISSPLVTDLEGDGVLEILVAAPEDPGALAPAYVRVFAWDANGIIKEGFPYQQPENPSAQIISILTAADYDGDGRMEIFGDSDFRGEPENRGGYIIGIDASGRDLPGFPIRTPGTTWRNGAIIGDVDCDGDYEIAATGEFAGSQNPRTELYLYDLPDRHGSSRSSWPTFHASNLRGGLQKGRYRGWRVVQAGTRIGGGR